MIQKPKFSEAHSGYMLSLAARQLSRNYLNLQARTRDYWIERMGDSAIDAITPEDLRKWLVALGESMGGASVDVHYRNIKSFWLWLEREELIAKSPTRKVARPKFRETIPDILTEREAHELLRAVRSDDDPNCYRDYCILFFFMDTGLRLEELSNLELGHVNLNDGYCRVLGKGNKERLVPLGISLREALSRYTLKHRHALAGEETFFTNRDGEGMGREAIRTMVVRALHDYVPRPLSKYGPHSLRHFFITMDLVTNGDMDSTREISGHADAKTTRRYNHLAAIMRTNRTSPMDAALKKSKKIKHANGVER